MPLPIIATVLSTTLISRHISSILLSVLAIVVTRTYFQGRKTNRERDLHGRVVLLTGAFTSTGLTLLDSLAQRGAHIIAISHHPIGDPSIALIIDAVRASTSNEHIFAEECDLTSPASIRAFCQRFLTGSDQRLDALVFGHEYRVVGSLLGGGRAEASACRGAMSLSTFLIVTLLLPPLLVAPPERDIRIVTVINPFYAAAIPTFTRLITTPPGSSNSHRSSASTFRLEGTRALRTAVLTRHLQRVFDALPAAPAIDPESGVTVSRKAQRSNIVAVCVSPGMSRSEVIAPLLRLNTFFGWISYILLHPLLLIFTKSPSHTIQSILHALFLPTPFKRVRPSPTTPTSDASAAASTSNSSSDSKRPPTLLDDDLPEEILKPGALYAECGVVQVALAKLQPDIPAHVDERKGRGKEKDNDEHIQSILKDDGELGGETLGRVVWEQYEAELKVWEAGEKARAIKVADDKTADKVVKEEST